MIQLVQDFTSQLREALTIGGDYAFRNEKRTFGNVVLTGLGGSGIGGSIVQNYAVRSMGVPFLVSKDYFLPSFVGADTLVIVSSYSGNTEETLSAMKAALKAKATVVCITSGGKVGEIAAKKGLDCILLPGGNPPRACIGYSMVQVLFILAYYGFIKRDFIRDINKAISLLDEEEGAIRKQAGKVAAKLLGKLPVIYSAPPFEGVAVRFRQQLNENSKMLAWHGVVPEMNHNELVGWREKDADMAAVFLRTDGDYERSSIRMDISRKVIRKYTSSVLELTPKGKSYWEQVFYFIHLTDYISVTLAALRGQDDMEIGVINHLKSELGKI